MALSSKILYNNTIQVLTVGTHTYFTPGTQTAKGYLLKEITFLAQSGNSEILNLFLYVKQGSGGMPQYLVSNWMLVAGQSYTWTKELTANANASSPDIIGCYFQSLSATQFVDCVVTGIERDQ